MSKIVKAEMINEPEPDSSKEAWCYYKSIYTPERWELFSDFDMENVQTYDEHMKGGETKKILRYLSWIKTESAYATGDKLGPCFRFGGDCCFNFNEIKYPIFKKILREEKIGILDKCNNMHHDYFNLAIIPTTGGLNTFKGKIGFDNFGNLRLPKKNEWIKSYDRFDTLVYFLNRFYLDNDELVLAYSGINKENLRYWLKLFHDIYEYCKIIYCIDDPSFVDKLINNGNKPIEKAKNIIYYMELAQAYWEIRGYNK